LQSLSTEQSASHVVGASAGHISAPELSIVSGKGSGVVSAKREQEKRVSIRIKKVFMINSFFRKEINHEEDLHV
jgi:hypothetical protein